jgi:hypothetical protein
MGMGILTTAVAVTVMTLGIRVLGLGLWAVPCGWIAGWLVRGAVTTLRLASGDWTRRRLA